MRLNNKILENWFFISGIGSVLSFLLAISFTRNWKVALITAVIFLIIIGFYNPKRRYIKAFYFILTLIFTQNKFSFELIGQLFGFKIKLAPNNINNTTSVFLILLAGLTVVLDYKERNKQEKNIFPDSSGGSSSKNNYISKRLYISSQAKIGVEALQKTKSDLEVILKNYKFQRIEHKAEIEKIDCVIERFEKELILVIEEIYSIKNNNRE